MEDLLEYLKIFVYRRIVLNCYGSYLNVTV